MKFLLMLPISLIVLGCGRSKEDKDDGYRIPTHNEVSSSSTLNTGSKPLCIELKDEFRVGQTAGEEVQQDKYFIANANNAEGAISGDTIFYSYNLSAQLLNTIYNDQREMEYKIDVLENETIIYSKTSPKSVKISNLPVFTQEYSIFDTSFQIPSTAGKIYKVELNIKFNKNTDETCPKTITKSFRVITE